MALLNGTATAGAPSTKRRKLSVKEKEEKRLEKEAREKEKAEQKARREEEKRIKDEERRKKNEEKEEKKRAKELEQQQKEEAMRRKDASQAKLSAFFVKPKSTAALPESPTKNGYITKETACRSSLTGEPTELSTDSPATSQSPKKPVISDYELSFLPFAVPSHTTLAPQNQYITGEADLDVRRETLDSYAQAQTDSSRNNHLLSTRKRKFHELVDFPPDQSCERGSIVPSVANIIARLQGSSGNPIDLTEDASESEQQPLELLQTVSMKYLHFGEDVRPPYFGTFTRVQSRVESRRLARNPFKRTLPEVNYDYDSEAEWEEGDEGEAVDSEDEEDEESNDGDEDLEGFLDDDSDTSRAKRSVVSGDLEPVCSGLCWEEPSGTVKQADGSVGHIDFSEFKMEFILDSPLTTLDPFSTAYWPTSTNAPTTTAPSMTQATANGLMQPPSSRVPLQSRLNGANGAVVSNTTLAKPSIKSPNATGKPKRLVPDDQLEAFKRAIDGSDMTKIAIIEALKKQFPRLPKDAIVNTLTVIASRVGKGHANKRWVVTDK